MLEGVVFEVVLEEVFGVVVGVVFEVVVVLEGVVFGCVVVVFRMCLWLCLRLIVCGLGGGFA